MAPELVQQKEYDGYKVDVWAVGIILFVMLCGFFPFRGKTSKELHKKINEGVFSLPNTLSK